MVSFAIGMQPAASLAKIDTFRVKTIEKPITPQEKLMREIMNNGMVKKLLVGSFVTQPPIIRSLQHWITPLGKNLTPVMKMYLYELYLFKENFLHVYSSISPSGFLPLILKPSIYRILFKLSPPKLRNATTFVPMQVKGAHFQK